MATDRRLILDDETARRLAAEIGTPMYVMDERLLRESAGRYRDAWRAAHGKVELHYGSKANSELAILAIVRSEGLGIDAASEGEMRAAIRAGVPPSEIALHGNNKSPAEVEFALRSGVKRIIVDSMSEIDLLETAWTSRAETEVHLRVAPDVEGDSHTYTSTAAASKFGFSISDGSAERALLDLVERRMTPEGLHCHVGSQLVSPEAHYAGARQIAEFAAEMKRKHGFEARAINLGGGLGISYTSESPVPVEEFCDGLARAALAPLKGTGLEPTLIQEPGRSIVAEAGVTLYTVGVVKSAGDRRFVAVDGGLADNPRPAMYGALYAVRPVSADGREFGPVAPAEVVSRHCESDPLIPQADLPSDLRPGDLLQALCTGAYCSSMASRYNRYPLPPTVLLREGGDIEVVTRMETWDEMFARETVPEDLRK